MKTKFEFPIQVKQYMKSENIEAKEIKEKILNSLDEDLLDKNYNPIKCKEIKVVVNGIFKNQKNKIFISQKKISKKKPLRTISSVGPKYSVYYLIFKEK
jgi:hypothetical protein